MVSVGVHKLKIYIFWEDISKEEAKVEVERC
jgi:hypothetical protein